MTSEPEPNQKKRTRSLGRVFKQVVVVWLCLKVAGCFILVPGPWGPKVGGKLPNGAEVYFQARSEGRETDDRLTIIVSGQSTHFWVDRIHAGFGHVTIKYANGGRHVWVESDGKVGASLDMATRDFRGELVEQHDWAVYGSGEELDSGRTWGVIDVIGPW